MNRRVGEPYVTGPLDAGLEDTAFVKWLELRLPTLADKHIGNIRAACALSATRPAQEAVAGVSFVFHWDGSETGPAPVS